jgi:hypothetical protein
MGEWEKVGRKQDVVFAWRRESIYKWWCVGGLKLMDKEKKGSDTQMTSVTRGR